MKIEIDVVTSSSIEKFAEQYGLEIKVIERKEPIGSPTRYHASFERAEIKDGAMLHGAYGNGSTPEEAIQNYAEEIEMKTLVINAYSDDRRVIEVPRLINEK